MGLNVSQVLVRDSKVSKATEEKIQTIFEILRANPKIPIQTLDELIEITKNENILSIHDEYGYNILQKSVGLNHVDLTKWILQRHVDVNRSPCSLPLHIACLKGYDQCVEFLLKHGARLDTDARMCYPHGHCHNCEESGKYQKISSNDSCTTPKLQNAICYAIDGDQVNILNMLTHKQKCFYQMPFRQKKPLLHLACERGAWKCVQQLVITRSEEINLIKDEYYPIHQAVLHDIKFLEILIQHGANTQVRTCTQQMTLLHVVIFAARKSAEDTLNTLRMLLQNGCHELINAPDSLGNTPLHALIVRYALEEARYGYDKWTKWDVLHLVRFMLQNGAKNSINQAGNSALACVFRHVRDWEVCFELLNMLIKEDGDPNIVGRDGSVPIMVCLVPLINKDQLHHFTHSMKVCYLNCIRILLQYGANPNCSYRGNLTPLHVLVFTVSENFTLNCDVQKRTNFEFIKNILLLLLQHGLDCNKTYQHILQAVVEMIQNVRSFSDMLCIYQLTLTLIQYGADPNIVLQSKPTPGSTIFSNEIANFGENLCHAATSAALDENDLATPSSSSRLQNNSNGHHDHFRNSFRTNSRYILFYYIILITKKEFILSDKELNYTSTINLFFLTMQHEPLYNCLKSLHNFYVAQVPNKKTEPLIQLISSLYRKPRSLKQMSRVAIYSSLNRKLAQNINRLNLPGPLKEYVLNFET